MPRFTPDPTKATAGFLTYPKGNYRVEIGDPKSFFNPAKPGNKGDNYGVKFPGKIISSIDQPAWVGKPFPIQCFQHTEGALNYSKSIQIAALGCKKDEEFNQKYGDKDWTFNTDDQSCGEGWHLMKGQVIDVECGDIGMNDKQEEQTGSMTFKAVL